MQKHDKKLLRNLTNLLAIFCMQLHQILLKWSIRLFGRLACHTRYVVLTNIGSTQGTQVGLESWASRGGLLFGDLVVLCRFGSACRLCTQFRVQDLAPVASQDGLRQPDCS